MAKKEIKTDLWVYGLLQEAGLDLTPQGCDIKEVAEALQTASKSKTGNAGYPEYCGIVKDFLLVIEDKAALENHLAKDEKGLIMQDVKSVRSLPSMAHCSTGCIWRLIPHTTKCWLSACREVRNAIG